jgi:predicted oxidoreductase
VIEPFVRRVREAESRGLVTLRFRHRVTALTKTGGSVDGVEGDVLEPSNAARGTASSRRLAGSFALRAQAVIVTSGGIGGNHDLVRRATGRKRLGSAPRHMISGVPEHVDGLMLDVVKASGASVINSDRMWHYPRASKITHRSGAATASES